MTELAGRTAPRDVPVLGDLSRVVAEVVRLAPHPPRRISVKLGDARLDVDWGDGGTAGPAETAADPAGDEDSAGLHQVCAPLVGTFYRCPQPGAAPFAEVGDVVEGGQQVAIVEAMKLMNPVEADVTGRVARVLVADGEPVEYGQPLLLIAPG